MRIDEITPAFDVFLLGKVLWSMVSGQPFLRLWYYDKPQFNVTELFPKSPGIEFANRLFAKCVVEDQSTCLCDAGELLKHVDETLLALERKGDTLGDNVERCCRVCGMGKYRRASRNKTDDCGFRASGSEALKLFTCDYCGHVQLFLIPDQNKGLPAWSEDRTLP